MTAKQEIKVRYLQSGKTKSALFDSVKDAKLIEFYQSARSDESDINILEVLVCNKKTI